MRIPVLIALVACALVGLPGLSTGAESVIPESKVQHDARMKWWREARFGMFIHWGLYAVPAGRWDGEEVKGIGEWIMNNAHIPVDQYEQFASQFDPEKFDAKQWV